MKTRIREDMRRLRRLMTKEERAQKSRLITQRLLECPELLRAECVLLYMSAFGEPDISGVLGCLCGRSIEVAVPVTDRESGIIVPSRVDLKTVFKSGAWGISEPEVIEAVDVSLLDAAVVPGLAFDRRGARIGFGKGCYDRLLSDTRALKIGVCYDFQLVPNAFAQPHDAAMNMIFTESEMIRCV